ncbi:MAG: precorrin-4 C(11)-methyltransferase [Desulfovibrio sp.]|nr:MAG: precorrin-4 C(11)-methyltransferase [Desulfovibrio sp.]
MHKVQVYFIGAGTGDPELITVKGKRLIQEADLVLYAGSLVPQALVTEAKPEARVEDSSPMTLEQTHALIMATVAQGGMVARVHTGDPSLYGAVREQARLLEVESVAWEQVPGVSAVFAAAGAAKESLTIPELRQSLIVTRAPGRTPVPESESLRSLAAHKAAMAVYLSGSDVETVVSELQAGGLDGETLIIAAHRLGWPGEKVVRSTLAEIAEDMEPGMERQTVFLILPGEGGGVSRLYAEGFSHGFRP